MQRSLFIAFCFVFFSLCLTGCNSKKTVPQPADTPAPTLERLTETIVSLTFDDGNADNFMMASLLKENGLSATFYIPSGLVGKTGHMTWEQLHVLQSDGSEVGGHTLDHTKVQGLDSASLKHEICDDRDNLINHGFDPVSFAYPFGNYDEHAAQMVQYCGYLSARTVKGGPQESLSVNPYMLQSLPYIVDDTDAAKLMHYVGETRKEGGGWVILIFHHVCDGCDFFSVKPSVMDVFIPWLAHQQTIGHVKVMTVGQVILSGTTP